MELSAVIEAVVSAGLFAVLWVVVGNGVFRPFFEFLQEREARTSGAERKAIELRNESASTQAIIEEQLRQTRFKYIQLRDAEVAKTKQQANQMLSEVGERCEKRIQESRESLSLERSRALADLEREVAELSQLVVDRILTGSNAPTVH